MKICMYVESNTNNVGMWIVTEDWFVMVCTYENNEQCEHIYNYT